MPPKSSQMVPLGTTSPDFILPDGSGTEHTTGDAMWRPARQTIFERANDDKEQTKKGN